MGMCKRCGEIWERPRGSKSKLCYLCFDIVRAEAVEKAKILREKLKGSKNGGR